MHAHAGRDQSRTAGTDINQRTQLMVTDERGEIDGASEQGVFGGDTRLVSYYALYVDGAPWTLRTSGAVQCSASRIELPNPALATDPGDLPAQQVGPSVRRRVTHGIHEDVDLISYAEGPVHVQLEIALRSDFADVFEVPSRKFVRRGNTQSRWHDSRCELQTTCLNGDFHPGVVFQLVDFDSKPQWAMGGSFSASPSIAGSWWTFMNAG